MLRRFIDKNKIDENLLEILSIKKTPFDHVNDCLFNMRVDSRDFNRVVIICVHTLDEFEAMSSAVDEYMDRRLSIISMGTAAKKREIKKLKAKAMSWIELTEDAAM